MSYVRLPHRFEALERSAENWRAIIVPIEQSLRFVDRAAAEINSSGCGAFTIFRGRAGVGKTTFLKTIPLFREGVHVESISRKEKIPTRLNKISDQGDALRIIVIEDREAQREDDRLELTRSLQSINNFIRSEAGCRTLVAWPVNDDSTELQISELAQSIAAEALSVNGEVRHQFRGPEKHHFARIIAATISTLNEGRTISDYGISDGEFRALIDESETVGSAIQRFRTRSNEVSDHAGLIERERFKLWIIVAGGNEPASDVAALTRSTNNDVDIDRLVTSTQANIVSEIQKNPEKLGLVSNSLDVKLFHLPILTALSCFRAFASPALQAKMSAGGLSIKGNERDARNRLKRTELARAIIGSGAPIPLQKGKIGPNTRNAFEEMVKIAENSDSLMNDCLGRALRGCSLAETFAVEDNLGGALNRRTDLVLDTPAGRVRSEVMWRKRTGRAEISNYVLTKIWNYGRATELLD